MTEETDFSRNMGRDAAQAARAAFTPKPQPPTPSPQPPAPSPQPPAARRRTTVVNADTTADFDLFVGRGRKRALPDGRLYESSMFSPAYMRHEGYEDWRDVQAWRYFANMLRRLLSDPGLRRMARDLAWGKRLGSLGEQGVRTARVLAAILDQSGIMEHADDEAWCEGFWQAMCEQPGWDGAAVTRSGWQAGTEFMARRAEICGVHEGYKDPGTGEEHTAE
ncbi:MAG: hypothetical protein IT464_12850 [Planctomycetes bacterium]|nr:hypothetical protein [Planctomycetota bacterium]